MTTQPMRTQPGMFQARTTVVRASDDASRAAWRRSELALAAGALWLVIAVMVAAAGVSALSMLLAVAALLWVWIAGVEALDTRSRSAQQMSRVRHQSMAFRG
jgi:Flp pilus assembly protein TadB